MPRMTHPDAPEAIEVRTDQVEMYESQGWTGEADELKGAALDDALDAAGLPKSGSADEKRARYAEHVAAQAADE